MDRQKKKRNALHVMSRLLLLLLYVLGSTGFFLAPPKTLSTRCSFSRLQAHHNRHVDEEKPVLLETWRVYGLEVHPDELCNNSTVTATDDFVPPAAMQQLYKRLQIRQQSNTLRSVRVVRRSLDARLHKHRHDGSKGPRFVYVLDVDLVATRSGQRRRRRGRQRQEATIKLKHQPGRMERLSNTQDSPFLVHNRVFNTTTANNSNPRSTVIIVGAGPCGLFCALQLARAGLHPIVLERGQAVETRGKDIGALMHRRSLDTESNFAFGEGGAGTWSDGKLTTRIGRNSQAVRSVLETLVEYGAPANILYEGGPHLGTDNLVRLLRNMRLDLRRMGGEIRFGTRVSDIIIEQGVAKGVHVMSKPVVERQVGVDALESEQQHVGTSRIDGDAVVLAAGHSARDMFEMLHDCGVALEPKGFAVGFRVEHPQKVINKIQYGQEWGRTVVTGKKKTDEVNRHYFESLADNPYPQHDGHLPVPSYRLATDEASDGQGDVRGVYSFCMCPGGQIVPASTDPAEVCVNGMSFSKRDSQWANSALVVTVRPDDPILLSYRQEHGVLAGVAFQRDMERRAAQMGGGNLQVPVQRLVDFLSERQSVSVPPSSYRLGVTSGPCHAIYPKPLTTALQSAVADTFEKKMPGFVCEDALLHGVETRTSCPVRISRDETTLQSFNVQRLFPAGEGAGFAGGIVSAAVDGMAVAQAVQETVCGADNPRWQGSTSARSSSSKGLDSFY